MRDWQSNSTDDAVAVLERLAGVAIQPEIARTYSQHVRLRVGRPAFDSWSDSEFHARFADVVRLVESGFLLRDVGNPDWANALRRAAEILEWLNHPSLNSASMPLGLLAAACYSLAGYPARSTCLIREDNEMYDGPTLLHLLLSSDFGALQQESLRAVRLASEVGTEPTTSNLASRELARALGVVAAEMRWGDDSRIELALAKLESAAPALREFLDDNEWLTLRLTAECARTTIDNSMRGALDSVHKQSTGAGKTALERFARLAYLEGRGVAWPSQAEGLRRLSAGGSFALCTPTGSGKTTVAEVALIDGLLSQASTGMFDEFFSPICLYIVPTRALAAEVERKLKRVFKSVATSGITVTGLYGGTDWGATDSWLYTGEPTVLICTQEKAEALVRYCGEIFVSRLQRVIVDEAHEVAFDGDDDSLRESENRQVRLEALVTRLRLARPDARFIAISAVARGIQRPLSEWITAGNEQSAVSTDYRSTRQLVGKLICQPRGETRIEYDLLDGSDIRVGSSTDGPFVPSPFPPHPESSLTGVQKGLAPYALWSAIQLASGSGASEPGPSVLISLVTARANFMKWFLQLLEEDWRDAQLPSFFSPPTDSAPEDLASWDAAVACCRDYFGEESSEFRLLKRGIVVHHGKMPGALPRLLVDLIERKVVRLVVATSTLSQGVNLPFETVIVPLLRRQQRIDGKEFGNLVGRAGRPGVSTEGQALVLVAEGNARAQSDYQAVLAEFAQQNETSGDAASPVAALLESIREMLPQLDEPEFILWLETTAASSPRSDEELGPTEALDALDAVILPFVEELGSSEETEAELEAELKRAWRATFASVARVRERDLESMFVARGSALRWTIYPEDALRKRIYRSGVAPTQALGMFDWEARIAEHLRTGSEYVRWSKSRQFEYIEAAARMFSEAGLLKLPDHPPQSSSAPTMDVLRWWLDPEFEGVSPTVPQIGNWHSFISEHFGYRFSWILGSIISDAAGAAETRLGLPVSPEDWVEIGYPWSVAWLKELLTWGTLDPIVAYLLSRGLEPSRALAAERSIDYHFYWSASRNGKDVLDPSSIREWAATEYPFARRRAPNAPPPEIHASLTAPLGDELAFEQIRVLPVVNGRSIAWHDAAGYEVARSLEDDPVDGNSWGSFDFTLYPSEGAVRARTYLS